MLKRRTSCLASLVSWLCAVCVLAVSLMPGTVRKSQADEHAWIDLGGGLFTDAANWDIGVPTSTDTAVFDLSSGGYTVTFGGAISNDQLIIRTDDVTFDLGGFTYSLSAAAPHSVIVGENGSDDGMLTIQNGVLSGTRGLVGHLVGSTGTVNLTGVSSTWASSAPLIVGGGGTGTVTVEQGATLSNTSSATIGDGNSGMGTVTVTDSGSMWDAGTFLNVGHTGTAILNVLNGGTVSVNGTANLGDNGGDGTLTVDGVGSSLTTNGNLLNVGHISTSMGTMMIQNGGSVSSGQTRVGQASTAAGDVTVTGAGSNWTASGTLTVGGGGTGTVTVEQGATLSNTSSATIGDGNSGMGTVTVTDSGSMWDAGTFLNVGHTGTAILNVLNGGTVSVNGTANLGDNGGDGTLTVDGVGSTFTTNGNLLRVGHISTSMGTMMIQNGGSVSSGQTRVGQASTAAGDVTVTGTGSIWTNTGSLFVGGNDTMAGGTGTISVETGATLDVGGTLKVWDGGTLNLTGGTITPDSFDFEGASTINLNDGLLQLDGGTGTAVDLTLDGSIPADLPILELNAGATTTLSGEIFVGSSNMGVLTVQGGSSLISVDGSIAQLAGSDGTVTVDGSGSIWDVGNGLFLGRSGTGTLNITGGGSVDVDASTNIGDQVGSQGTATVSGTNSSLTIMQELVVGRFSGSNNTLTIDGGGAVSSNVGFIGRESGSVGTVTASGATSTWTITDALTVGAGGTGTLTIEQGASVSNTASATIGGTAAAMGTVTVTDSGSMWDAGTFLNIGNAGTAILNVSNGGTVSVNGTANVGDNGANGTLTVTGAGSTLTTNGNLLRVGHLSTAMGTMTIQDGGSVFQRRLDRCTGIHRHRRRNGYRRRFELEYHGHP